MKLQTKTKHKTIITETTQTERRNNQTKKKKMNVVIMKKNNVWKETHIAFSQEPRLENSQVGNWKSKRPIDEYPHDQHHRIKRFNLWRSKINQWKKSGFLWRPQTESQNPDGNSENSNSK